MFCSSVTGSQILNQKYEPANKQHETSLPVQSLDPSKSLYDASSTIGNEFVVSHRDSITSRTDVQTINQKETPKISEQEASLSKQSTNEFDFPENESLDTLRLKGFVDRLEMGEDGAASVFQLSPSVSSVCTKTGAHLNRNRAKARWLTAYKKITDSFDEHEVIFQSYFYISVLIKMPNDVKPRVL